MLNGPGTAGWWTLWWIPLLLGPVVGSFLSVVVTRVPAGTWPGRRRSHCPLCDHVLAPKDLIPLVSWALAHGRCSYCRGPLPVLYPGLELAAMLVPAWAALEVSGWLLWASCALGWTLLALAVIDWTHLRLPDGLTLPLLAGGLLAAIPLGWEMVVERAAGAAIGFALFLGVAALYRAARKREGLGAGDAKLMAAAGAWVSWEGLASVIFLAAGAALAVAVMAAVRGRSLDRTERIPFGPYLGLATWLVWLYGPVMIG